jgi:hypothetical protein
MESTSDRSQRFQLDKADLRKTIRDLLVAALVLFGASQFTSGEYELYLDALSFGVVQLLWRFVKQN